MATTNRERLTAIISDWDDNFRDVHDDRLGRLEVAALVDRIMFAFPLDAKAAVPDVISEQENAARLCEDLITFTENHSSGKCDWCAALEKAASEIRSGKRAFGSKARECGHSVTPSPDAAARAREIVAGTSYTELAEINDELC